MIKIPAATTTKNTFLASSQLSQQSSRLHLALETANTSTQQGKLRFTSPHLLFVAGRRLWAGSHGLGATEDTNSVTHLVNHYSRFAPFLQPLQRIFRQPLAGFSRPVAENGSPYSAAYGQAQSEATGTFAQRNTEEENYTEEAIAIPGTIGQLQIHSQNIVSHPGPDIDPGVRFEHTAFLVNQSHAKPVLGGSWRSLSRYPLNSDSTDTEQNVKASSAQDSRVSGPVSMLRTFELATNNVLARLGSVPALTTTKPKLASATQNSLLVAPHRGGSLERVGTYNDKALVGEAQAIALPLKPPPPYQLWPDSPHVELSRPSESDERSEARQVISPPSSASEGFQLVSGEASEANLPTAVPAIPLVRAMARATKSTNEPPTQSFYSSPPAYYPAQSVISEAGEIEPSPAVNFAATPVAPQPREKAARASVWRVASDPMLGESKGNGLISSVSERYNQAGHLPMPAITLQQHQLTGMGRFSTHNANSREKVGESVAAFVSRATTNHQSLVKESAGPVTIQSPWSPQLVYKDESNPKVRRALSASAAFDEPASGRPGVDDRVEPNLALQSVRAMFGNEFAKIAPAYPHIVQKRALPETFSGNIPTYTVSNPVLPIVAPWLQRKALPGASGANGFDHLSPLQPTLPGLTEVGQPLERSTQTRLGRVFGANFDNVRIHTDSTAAGHAARMGAEAFTVGSNIFFGEGRYQPHTSTGQALIGHELTHVVQQANLPSLGGSGRIPEVSSQGQALEREAIHNEQLILHHLNTSSNYPTHSHHRDTLSSQRQMEAAALYVSSTNPSSTASIERSFEPLMLNGLGTSSGLHNGDIESSSQAGVTGGPIQRQESVSGGSSAPVAELKADPDQQAQGGDSKGDKEADLNRVAEKVYLLLRHRLLIERERSGTGTSRYF